MIILRQKEFVSPGLTLASVAGGALTGEIIGGKIAKNKAKKNVNIEEHIRNHEKEIEMLNKDLKRAKKNGGICVNYDEDGYPVVLGKDDIEFELSKKINSLDKLKTDERYRNKYISKQAGKDPKVAKGLALGVITGMSTGLVAPTLIEKGVKLLKNRK